MSEEETNTSEEENGTDPLSFFQSMGAGDTFVGLIEVIGAPPAIMLFYQGEQVQTYVSSTDEETRDEHLADLIYDDSGIVEDMSETCYCAYIEKFEKVFHTFKRDGFLEIH